MGLIVQKFGGTSVANAERINHVADIIADTYRAGNNVIVVLSAQGDTTDELIEKHHIVSFPEEDSLRVKYHNRYRTRNITRARLADLILQKFGSNSLEGIPGAYLKGEQWTFAGPSGLVFPMYDLDGNTFRLRIRKDFSDIDATVITSGQDRFYYAEGKKYFISSFIICHI